MDNFAQAFALLEEIGSTSSRLRKEVLLMEGADNEVFKRMLYETYNNFRVFNVKKVGPITPTRKEIANDPQSQKVWDLFMSTLDDLADRKVTGNAALTVLMDLFASCTPTESKWYMKVLQKDMKIGITDKTINKVYKGMIPTFSAMLAEPFKKSPKLPKRFCMDPKLDGYRCLAFNNEDEVVLLTRNGNLLLGYLGIEEDVAKLPKGYVYDGEILGKEGSFNSIQKSAFTKTVGKEGVLNIFDSLSIEDFYAGGGKVPYCDRLAFLDTLHDQIAGNLHNLTLVLHSKEYSNDEAGEHALTEYHHLFTGQGYEGTMVKDLDAPYQCRRTKGIMKVKDMDNIDLVVVAVEEGEAGTDREGMLGALVVEYEGNTVNVGSGYSREQCRDFWDRKAELINKTIEIQYQESTVNKKGQKSLRFPVFVKFRDDK